MKQVEEVSEISHVHTYSLSLRTLTWATVLVIVVMASLYAFLGLPPGLDTYYAKMYFHSIGIGMTALATYLVLSVFDLQKNEPPLDFPISYRAFGAVLFAAAGAFFYLTPVLDTSLPDIPLGLIIVAFILIGDVGGALFIQLVFLPRKIAGTYDSKTHVISPVNYFLRMLPSTKKDLAAYSKMSASYWLAIAAVGSAFVAGMLGFINLWIRLFGPSFFAGYMAQLGLDAQGALDATLDPHSHEMAVAIMAGVVALVAHRFKVFDLRGLKKNLARIGLWAAVIGVVAMTIVFIAIPAANFSPPTLIPSGPEEINGIAGDDAVMAIIAFGTLVALVPLALTKLDGKSSWRDSVRLTLLGTWLVAFIINVIQAFFIELNEDSFTTTLSANDAVFSNVQPMFGIFLLTGISLVLIAVDYYEIRSTLRRAVGWLAGIGIIIAVAGAITWVLLDPTIGDQYYWVHIVGVVVIGISALIAVGAIYKVKIKSISIS